MELFTAAMELLTAAIKYLKFSDAHQIIGEAVKILSESPSPLFLITTITLILPLSLAQLFCKISFSHFLLTLYPGSTHEFFSIFSLFLLSLLSTSAIVFIVASLYASKSVSLIPTLFAVPRISKHLLITFFYAFVLLKAVNYNLVIWYSRDFIDLEGVLWWDFHVHLIHSYFIALWHLASVISVVEPNVYGWAAIMKSKQLLQGRAKQFALELLTLYFTATWILGKVFGYATQFPVHFMVKLMLELLCLFLLVAVNLTGLLVQSVFYFSCKTHNNETVDKKVLHDQLCWYDLSGNKPDPPSTGSLIVYKRRERYYQDAEIGQRS